MARYKAPINPFYVLCAVAGVVFTITACAYGVLMLRANRGLAQAAAAQGEGSLMSLLDQHGTTILSVELSLLVVVSLAAILLDHYRGQRSARPHSEEEAKK